MSARQRALEIDPEARGPALPPVDYGYRSPQPPPAAYAPAYGPPPDLSGLEQQLRNITTQIENLNRPGELTDALSGLRSDLAEIARMLTEAMPRRAVEALEIEVRKLAERIDFTREAGVDPSTIANMERGLADLREALGTLTPAESLVGFDDAVRGLSRKIDQMALQHDPANLQQLEAAITALRGIVSHVASNDTLMGLAEEMRGLSAKVDRVASAAIGPDGLLPQAQSGEPVLLAIERGFAELTSRLFELQSHSMAGGQAPEVMDHLKRDLERTQDLLEAVHGTLGHLVDRLAVIEGGVRPDASMPPPAPGYHPGPSPQPPFPAHPGANGRVGPPPAGPMAAAPDFEPPMPATPMMEPPAPQAPAPSLVSLPAIVPPPPETAEPPPAPKVRPPVARDRQPIDPNLPPDFPLEPGSGVPRARPPGSAAERIAASEAALGPARQPNANHPGQTNFIAAARRAAQAAGPGIGPDAPPQAEPAKPDKPAKSLSQRVRSLIVGGSAVLVVIASMRIALNVMEPTPETATESVQTVQVPEPVATSSVPADRIPVVRKNDGVFAATPPAGLIMPGEPISKPDTVPVARAPDPDITGSIGPRGAAPAPTSDPRPILSDKLPASLRQAATGGDPAAEYEVALRHLDGRGVPQNLEEAARWLERSAKAGLAPAQFRLGGLYEKGQGVKKNLDTARRHYVAAAEKGNAKAMHNLAVMYSEGVDGKPDYKAASLWFRKAAEHGIADSQYNLGVLYARGVGIDRNLARILQMVRACGRPGRPRGGQEARRCRRPARPGLAGGGETRGAGLRRRAAAGGGHPGEVAARRLGAAG